MFDIYITREIRKESIDKSVKIIENIDIEVLNNTIEKFNQDLGFPDISSGCLVWENNYYRVEAIILDSNTKSRLNCMAYIK
tara:strand:+ start:294 stop:536 length:243 start_codon:yes stop_codon:yes gene_type:complete